MGAYAEAFARASEDPEGFWGDAAQALQWDRRWDRVLDDSRAPLYRWFQGGALNNCKNAVDRHVEAGRGDRAAIIHDSAMTGETRTISYRELLREVEQTAGALAASGVEKGDRVVLYMPMIPEAVVAMLACARIGAVHSVVFGGFAAKELAVRIDDATPKAIMCASCGLEPGRVVAYKPLLDEAIAIAAHSPERVFVLQRPQCEAAMSPGRDLDWREAAAAAAPAACVETAATDPLYILYTSGTTGSPKGVVRDHGGHAVALHWSMKNVYDAHPDDVFWAASDVGWIVGHSYICYAPLLIGATTVIYEGKPVGTPDAGAFWRVIQQHEVAHLFTAPTALRAIRQVDPDGAFLRDYDLSCLRTLFMAGERLDPDTLFWAQQKLGVPVIDHWWQTETGWAIAANFRGLEPMPIKPGSPTAPSPGFRLAILDEGGQPVPAGQMGAIALKLPLPPSCLPTLWNAEARFKTSYLETYPGYYNTGDAGYVDEDGYVFVMGRTDDVINVAGHRLSTGAMEEVLAAHDDVAECAVIGVADQLKGELPLGFVVLAKGVERPTGAIERELVQKVRHDIGPVAAFKRAIVVTKLPKTRSGKILRGTMKKIAQGEPWTMPATIDDPASLDEIGAALKG